MRLAWLLLWLCCTVGLAQAQAQAVLRGRVLDAETRQPVPNAQVGVAGNRIGTSTNEDGRFALSIPAQYRQEQLEVALIGYRKHSQPLPPLPGPELLVELRISPATLGEVQVTASVEGIVREAVARIGRNYPGRATRLTGFYRESDQDPAGKARYMAEGVVTVFKTPYARRTDDGEVQIQQSRKVDLRPQQAVRIAWFGGPFIAHRADFVHSRAQFIIPAHFRDYDYRLAPGSTFQERPVYVVTFAPKPGNRRADFEGRMYIDQDSYTFLGADWRYTAAGLARGLHPADARALRVRYQPYAGRWHLKNVWWQTKAHLPVGLPLHYFGEFLTTAIDTAQGPRLGYAERAQYRDIFLENAVPYDSAFWQNQTTILPSDSLQRALLDQQRQQRGDSLFARRAAAEAVPVTPAAPPGRVVNLLSRLRYGVSAGAWPLQVSGAGLALDYTPAGSSFRAQTTTTLNAQSFTGWWSGEYLFDLSDELAVRVATRSLFRQLRGSGWEAGLSDQHNLNPHRRPGFGRAGLAFSRQTVALRLGAFDNNGPVRVGGKELSAKRLGIQIQTVHDALLPTAGLGLELSHKVEMFAEASYLLPVRVRTQLQIKEESGFFLGRSSATLNLPSSEAALRVNDAPMSTLPWQPQRWLLRVGLLYRVR